MVQGGVLLAGGLAAVVATDSFQVVLMIAGSAAEISNKAQRGVVFAGFLKLLDPLVSFYSGHCLCCALSWIGRSGLGVRDYGHFSFVPRCDRHNGSDSNCRSGEHR